MYTYNDLLNVGENEVMRGKFLRSAVNSFMASPKYKQAVEGQAYYNKHNITIEKFQKFLTTISGKKVQDTISANYKLKTLFFRRLVIQQVQYVLGNGVTFENKETKKKLGKDFDFQLQKLAKRAMAEGRAFGFWNYDHLEVFGFADTPQEAGFCPLYDENTSKLMAGIRYWFKSNGKDKYFIATLYEKDGLTEYLQHNADDPIVTEPKQGYIQKIKKTKAHGIEDIYSCSYSELPIIQMYANDTHESELVGMRENIDCYDFVKSGFANNIDDFEGFYWIVKNAGGMDDVDLAQFLNRLKRVHAATLDAEAGVDAQANTAEVPTDARKTMLELLRSDIYEDFQALDVKTLSAAAKTTQEIQAAYQSQDNKCSDFEYYIIDFVQKVLELAGIDDNPTFVWNRVVNQQEQTQTLMLAANYLPEEIIIKHLPFLTPEEAEYIIQMKKDEEQDKFADDEDNDEETEDDEQASGNNDKGIDKKEKEEADGEDEA